MSLKDSLVKGTNILFIVQKIDEFEKAYAIIGLAKVLKNAGKSVDIYTNNPVPSYISDLFEKAQTLFLTDIPPRTFEITVDYAKSRIEKIVYDDHVDQKKLKFYITPGDTNFSFDSVQMKEGGARYDTTILFDIEDPKKLSSIYDNHEYLFKENSIVYIGDGKPTFSSATVISTKDSSYSEEIYNAIKSAKVDMGKEGMEYLLNGIINARKLLESRSDAPIDSISKLVSEGANFAKSLDSVYFSKNKLNADLQIKVMQNVKTSSKASLVFSVVNHAEVEAIGIKKDDADLRGRIPFNITKEYKVAVVAIEFEKNAHTLIIESNSSEEYSAIDFARIFGGDGDENHSVCEVKYWESSEIEDNLLDTLFGLKQ
ncbi:MAG TPA: hypothetical protein PLV59_03835 [Candidatus Dojkabacteria bacterium]|nr:hypothetical protein [Candidatus Dojkabacteria bacterium]